MSIEDESFPDEFFSELNFSLNTSKRFQFPNYKREGKNSIERAQGCDQNDESRNENEDRERSSRQCNDANLIDNRPSNSVTTSTNTSSASLGSVQNLSGESNTMGRPLSGLSDKTTASDSTGFENQHDYKKSEMAISNRSSKAVSYLDIHNEYTKRRFKHVESKVGQYIASLKAEEMKRRSTNNTSGSGNFQRHRSMPESFSGNGSNADGMGTVGVGLLNAMSAIQIGNYQISYSTAELHKSKMDESIIVSDAGVDSSEDITTSATSSTTQPKCNDTNTIGSSNGHGIPSSEFIDKLAYNTLANEKERIQSYSDYLQTKLDEKMDENMRLKRNVDYMRIELNSCKDKLKKQTSVGMPGTYGGLGLSSAYGNSMPRHSIASFLYASTKSTKGTQTETLAMANQKSIQQLPSPTVSGHQFRGRLDTLDANNNMYDSGSDVDSCKSVENIRVENTKTGETRHPLALNFSNIAEQDSGEGSGDRSDNDVIHQHTNSNSSVESAKVNTMHRSSESSRCPSSSDSAIDIESVEPISPRSARQHRVLQSGTQQPQQPQQQQRHQLQLNSRCSNSKCHEKSMGHSNRMGRKTTADMINHNCDDTITSTANNRRSRKESSLRRRWLRIFVPCTRCKDQNQTIMENSVASQCPLLEKSIENHCHNLR